MGTTGIGVTHAERKEVMSSCNLLCLVPTTDHQMDKEGYNGLLILIYMRIDQSRRLSDSTMYIRKS